MAMNDRNRLVKLSLLLIGALFLPACPEDGKDGAPFATIALAVGVDWVNLDTIAVAISPNGKYIALVGIDVSGSAQRMEIHEGA